MNPHKDRDVSIKKIPLPSPFCKGGKRGISLFAVYFYLAPDPLVLSF